MKNGWRHRAGDGNTEWYEAASALPQDWDGGLPEAHFLIAGSLAVHENIRLPHVAHRYAAWRATSGSIIARAAFQVLTLQPEHLRNASLPRWQWRAWQSFARLTQPKLLVGGHLFRHDAETVWYDEAATAPFDAFRWYRAAVRTAMKASCASAVLLKEPPQGLVPLLLHHAPDFMLLRNDSSMQLRIPPEWQSAKDYEGSLKHKYAQRLRKVRQPWLSLDVREMDAEEVSRAAGELFVLYNQVAAAQPVRVGLLNEAFLPALKKFYGDHLKVWGIREEGRLIAFASAWVYPDRFDMFYIGFDYARNAALQLYFNILFFAVEQAIAHQSPLLILGRTALEAKARVGCRPVYLNTFLYIRNPVLRRIIAGMQGRLSEGAGEWEQRHPFKKALHEI